MKQLRYLKKLVVFVLSLPLVPLLGIHTTIARGEARSKRNVVFWQHFDPFGAMRLTVSRIVPYGANRVVSPVNWTRRPVTMLA